MERRRTSERVAASSLAAALLRSDSGVEECCFLFLPFQPEAPAAREGKPPFHRFRTRNQRYQKGPAEKTIAGSLGPFSETFPPKFLLEDAYFA